MRYCWKQFGLPLNCRDKTWLFVSECTVLITWLSWTLRLDINNRRGRLLVYIKASLASKMLTKFKLPINIQIVPFKINLRKKKWLFLSIYKPPSQSNIYWVIWWTFTHRSIKLYLEVLIFLTANWLPHS